MGKAFDCSTPLTYERAKQFFDDGHTHVVRYLYHGWKGLTRQEALDISRAGLIIISVYEKNGDLASMTATEGLKNGATVLELAAEVGQPEGSCVYFTADFEPTPQDLPHVLEYIRACSESTPPYSTGAYGSFAVVEYVANNNGCSHFWQTYAWSHGHVSAHNNIYQDHNGVTLHGISVDDDVLSANVGGWQVFETAPAPVITPTLISETDAKKFAAMATELYKLDSHEIHGSDGDVWAMDHDEFHRLANVARTAGGLPTK